MKVAKACLFCPKTHKRHAICFTLCSTLSVMFLTVPVFLAKSAGCSMEAAMHTHTWRVWRNMALLLVCAVLLTACGAFRSAPDSGPAPESARKAVKTAYTQMGKKYRSGGASPQKGFDCSGLIWWAYRENGVKVPRITTDQARAGLRPGVNFAVRACVAGLAGRLRLALLPGVGVVPKLDIEG